MIFRLLFVGWIPKGHSVLVSILKCTFG
jgi:hypothetical protein